MDTNKSVMYFLLCCSFQFGELQTNVCTNHGILNASILKTDYVTLSNSEMILPGWYRYTGTTSGVIATSCPTFSNACGAKDQIWIEGPLPSFGSGVQNIAACIRTDQGGVIECCGMRNSIEIMNCNGYYVYYLTPLPSRRHYCFNATTPDLTTVTLPQTTVTTSSYNGKTTVPIPLASTLKISNTKILDAKAPDLTTITVLQTTVTTASYDGKTTVPFPLTSTLKISNTKNSDGPINNQQSPEPHSLTGTVVGCVIGFLMAACLIFAAVIYVKKSRKNRVKSEKHEIQAQQEYTEDPCVRNVKFNATLLNVQCNTSARPMQHF